MKELLNCGHQELRIGENQGSKEQFQSEDNQWPSGF
jgi:hypothetical protein